MLCLDDDEGSDAEYMDEGEELRTKKRRTTIADGSKKSAGKKVSLLLCDPRFSDARLCFVSQT